MVVVLAFLSTADKEDKKLSIGSSTVHDSILLKLFYIWMGYIGNLDTFFCLRFFQTLPYAWFEEWRELMEVLIKILLASKLLILANRMAPLFASACTCVLLVCLLVEKLE